MSNAPAPHEVFDVVGNKIRLMIDSKIPNALIVDIRKEDHTMGNIIRMALLRDERVIFAGYKMPHPLNHDIVLRFRVDDTADPQQVLIDVLSKLKRDIQEVHKDFRNALTQMDIAPDTDDMDADY